MKDKRFRIGYFLLLLIVILLVVIIAINLSNFIFPSATQIFHKVSQSILELKAVAEDVGESFGTALIIDSTGLCITNAHVVTYSINGAVKTFDSFYVRFSNSEQYVTASLIKFNNDIDVALLKIDLVNETFEPLKYFRTQKIDYGERVYAIGNATNYGISITQGIVSNPNVTINYENVVRDVIQCDIIISQGNSGGALLNNQGFLIAITSFRIRDNLGDVIYGVAYCIPINVALDYVYE